MSEQSPDLFGRCHPIMNLLEALQRVGNVSANGDVKIIDSVSRQAGTVGSVDTGTLATSGRSGSSPRSNR